MYRYSNMKIFKVVIAVALLTSSVSLFNSDIASAKWTHGYVGVSTYSNGNCTADTNPNRAGGAYVQNLKDGMVGNNLVVDTGTAYKDNSAWESDLTGSFANSVQFFAFSGHGYRASSFSSNEGAAAHLYTLNSSTSFHTSEFQDAANASWDEIRWGSNQLRWATMHQCYFLSDEGSTINDQKMWAMFNGIHLIMGYGTRMYLDSREGSHYAARLGAGWTIKDSFFDAAAKYQPQLPTDQTTSNPSGSVVARVKGHINFINDKWDSSTVAAPAYSSNNAGSFSTWSKTITATGNKIPGCPAYC